MNIFRVSLVDNSLIEQSLLYLKNCDDIIFAEYEGIPDHGFIPNDPLVTQQWHLEKVQAYDMWDVAQDANEVIIAIVDSGVKWNHEDFRVNDLISNIYLDPHEVPGVTIDWDTGEIFIITPMDGDGNGYDNDVMGWDFEYNDNNPFSEYTDEPGTRETHGTHVAGIAGAIGNNLIGISGIGMNVKLLISKHTGGDLVAYYGGIIYAADKGAHIINCSWGSPEGFDLAEAVVEYAYDAESLVVSIAHNDNSEIPNGTMDMTRGLLDGIYLITNGRIKITSSIAVMDIKFK